MSVPENRTKKEQIEGEVFYTDAVKAELERRYAEYKNGFIEMIDAEESRRRARKLLAAASR